MDGSLEQKYCQDPKANVDDPGPVLPECCACDEAKYELAFEGLWSRYTHPKVTAPEIHIRIKIFCLFLKYLQEKIMIHLQNRML